MNNPIEQIGYSDFVTTDGDAGGIWSSSDPSIASVNSTTGEVTALARRNFLDNLYSFGK